MLKRFRFTKTTAFILAVTLAAGGAIAAIGSTLAATPINWTAAEPDRAPTNQNYIVDLAGLKDSKNSRITMTATRAVSWGSSHTNIARVESLDGDSATYVALSPGMFVAYRTTSLGALGRNEAMVYDSTMPYEYTISKNHSVLKAEGKTDTIPITMKDMNGAVITGAVAWSSDNTGVATVEKNTGTITAVTGTGIANIIGKFTDCYGQEQKIHYSVVVGKVTEDHVVGPDDNGDYWLPVEEPPNIWEKVDEDGNPKQPPEYIYDTDGDPVDGNGIPAVKGEDGNFYIEDPKNIFTPVKPDGNLDNDHKIWGGDDFKPGNADDEDVVNMGTPSNPEYWVNFGENVFAQVSKSTGMIGGLKGGGLDRDPTTDPATPIFDNRAADGHFYFGPFTDQDGITYYIGDSWMDGTGDGLINTEDKAQIRPTDTTYYRQGDGTMTKEKPVEDVKATGIILGDPASDTIRAEVKQAAPSYTVVPNDATNQTVVWSSSNNAIATVDPNTGEVTGVAPGTVTVTATVTNKDGSKVSDFYQLTIKESDPWKDIVPVPGTSFEASGQEWIIVAVDLNGNALIMTKHVIGDTFYNTTQDSHKNYSDSNLRNVAEGFYSGTIAAFDAASKARKDTDVRWITDVAQPSNHVAQTTTYGGGSGLSSVVESGDKTCFPLSYQEVTAYLTGKDYLTATEVGSTEKVEYWTRTTPKTYGTPTVYYGVTVTDKGALNTNNNTYSTWSYGVRPAIWVKMF